MAVGHKNHCRFHLSGCNRGTAYPDNLYASLCRTFPSPCFADDISCTENRWTFQYFQTCLISLGLHSLTTAACNWCFSLDMVSPAFYKSEWNSRTCQSTPQTCQYRPLRLHKKPDAARRIFYSFRDCVYCGVPIPFVCLCADLCGLQCSWIQIYWRTWTGKTPWRNVPWI